MQIFFILPWRLDMSKNPLFATQWIPGTRSHGTSWREHEADRSALCTTEVKNACDVAGWLLIRIREVLGLNLGRNIGYPDRDFRSFP
jgi:hypothetical protein